MGQLAKEIADNKVAGSVIASSDNDLIDSEKLFFHQILKIYSSDDLQGVELAGALKNIMQLYVVWQKQ